MGCSRGNAKGCQKFRSSRIRKRARCRTSCCLGPTWRTLQPAGGPSRPFAVKYRPPPAAAAPRIARKNAHHRCLRSWADPMEKELDEVCEWRPPAKGPCPGCPPVWIQPLTGVPLLRVPAPVLLPLCPSGTLLPSLHSIRSVVLMEMDRFGPRQMYCGAVAERAQACVRGPPYGVTRIMWRLRRLEAS